jgi:hypothetical protein
MGDMSIVWELILSVGARIRLERRYDIPDFIH